MLDHVTKSMHHAKCPQLSTWGVGVKIRENFVHVVVEWPLKIAFPNNLYLIANFECSGTESNTFQIEWLYLTYGIMFGGGSSLTYTPSLVILGHYFKKHMGMVNGFVASGSSVFTFVMPHILEAILSTFGVIESNFYW